MSDFHRAVQIVLEHEAGYVNHRDDPGGETNFGISKRSYPHLDIKNLTKKEAVDIYRRDFWDACSCEALNWPLNLYLFDCAVNQGVGAAITILQRTLGVRLDGIIGPATLAAANAARASIGSDFMAERALAYTRMGLFGVFGRGWLRRLFKTVEVTK